MIEGESTKVKTERSHCQLNRDANKQKMHPKVHFHKNYSRLFTTRLFLLLLGLSHRREISVCFFVRGVNCL
jgi:hypothetical protein